MKGGARCENWAKIRLPKSSIKRPQHKNWRKAFLLGTKSWYNKIVSILFRGAIQDIYDPQFSWFWPYLHNNLDIKTRENSHVTHVGMLIDIPSNYHKRFGSETLWELVHWSIQSQQHLILNSYTGYGLVAVFVSKLFVGASGVLNMFLALLVTHENTFCTWNLVKIIYDAWVYTEWMQCAAAQ